MRTHTICQDAGIAINGHSAAVDNDESPTRIAIVGMGCRLPGQVSSPEDFWKLCSRGRSAWSETPASRFQGAAFHHPNPERIGTTNGLGGHFLDEDPARFDAPFFQITLQEARSLDPQQRLLLECTYEALENAGIPKQSLVGQNVGVFAGASFSDYDLRNLRDPETVPPHEGTGCAVSLQANRISYYFNLNGPSLTVDTACSSSLTALHLACQSLRTGECSIAIVSGAHLNLGPELYISLSQSGVLSNSGRSYAFDHKAGGFGRGEGAGCVILKPMDAALAAGDAVRAVVASTGVNQDGRTRGITMPNPAAQESLVRSVYKSAGLDPTETGYVEAHGTGTRAGDPLEAASLHAVFADRRTPQEPLFVGSVKTNIGHTEGASGVISVIKTVLMLEKGFIVPNYGFEKANEDIPLDKWNMKVPKKLVPWPRGKRYASINNFGFGGANAHVVLERVPILHDGGSSDKKPALTRKIAVLSGHEQNALRAVSKDLGFYLEQHPAAWDASVLNNLVYTLGQRRTAFPWRVAVSCSTTSELIQKLSTDPKPSRSAGTPAVGFVFTGQGAQWTAMGRALLPAYPVFRKTMEAVDDCLASLGAKFSIIGEIESADDTSGSFSTAYMSQPACTAIQLALTDLLRSWGVLPHAVTGHSSGEIAAAYAANILTLEECVRIAYARGAAAALLTTRKGGKNGSMMAVGAGYDEVQPLLDGLRGHRAVIACVNSELSVTVSGDDTAINELESTLEKKGLFARKLQVDVAYHSHHMRRVAKEYRASLRDIVPRASSILFHSTVRGQTVVADELHESYWVDNLVSRVEFVMGMRSLLGQKVFVDDVEKPISTVVEIGPHCALQTPIKQIIDHHFPNAKIQYVPSLRRKLDAVDAMQQLGATLWMQGVQLDFESVNFPGVQTGEERKPTLLTNLPRYPWNHSESYWHTSRLSDNLWKRPFPRSDILGSLSMENIDLEPRWRNIIRADDQPWIRQHRVHGSSVYPMAGFVAMAVEAIAQQAALSHLALDRIELRELSVGRALSIPEASSVETMLSMRPCTGKPGNSANLWHEFRIFSWAEGRGWDEHCHGFVNGVEKKEPNPVDGYQQEAARVAESARQAATMRARCSNAVDSDFLYEEVARCGMNYGPLFRGLADITLSDSHETMASLVVPETKPCMPREHESSCIVHPVLLDHCIQLVWVLFGYTQPGSTATQLPCFVKHLSIVPSNSLQPGSQLQLYGNRVSAPATRNPVSINMLATNPADPANPVIKMEGCVTVPVFHHNDAVFQAKPLCYREQFEPCFDFLSEADVLASAGQTDGSKEKGISMLDEVSYVYLRRALESVEESEVPSFKPHLQRLFRWAQEICGGGTTDASFCAEHGDNNQTTGLIQRVQAMNAVGELICKLGEHLPQMLRSEIDPLEIMLEGDLLDRYYENNDPLRQVYNRAIECVDKMAHQNPNLNILEVGSGAGGATLPFLQTLGGQAGKTPRFGHFTFTDASPSLFENAKTKFKSWGHLMSYKTLDVSSDPVPQGFEPHSYDVVLAAHVLHATSRIRQTMAHVRRLLKPGGKLLIIEETRIKSSHFKYALLPDWWLSEEPDRANGPFMDRNTWNQVLKENGFSGVDLGVDDYPGGPQRSNTFMVSSASNAERSQPLGDVIVITPGSFIPGSWFTLMRNLEGLTNHPVSCGDLATDVTGKLCIFLDEPDAPILSTQTPERFQALQRLLAKAKGMLWVIRKGNSGPESLMTHFAVGLARTVRSETSLPFATLDVGEQGSLSETQIEKAILDVFNGVFCNPSVLRHGDMDFVVQQGRICVSRVVDDPDLNQSLLQDTEHAPPQLQGFRQPSRPLKMVPGEGGALNDCFFTDDDAIHSPLPDEYVEVQVTCVGLNFRDVLVAMGQINGGSLGQECSGIITAVGAGVENFRVGDRVCATTPGSLASHVRCPATSVWRVPNKMTSEVAASIPLVFLTAYYSLIDVGRLAPGESVLIHAAAGGVGQAAIIVAQDAGAHVFATVSSEEKKRLLMDVYQVPENHIFFSRDTSFARGIQNATGGQGVDVVLNSLTGDALRVTFECLAPFGRFVELGKRDIVQNAGLEMAHFDNNVSFSSVDLNLVIQKRPALLQRLLHDAFRLVSLPSIQARWSITNFSIADIETAFRALQSGRTMGKIIVRMEENARVKVHPARKSENILSPDTSYIIAGGTRGIGLDIARWMPEKGARHLILISRSGAVTEEAQYALKELQAKDVNVEVCRCDVGDAGDMERRLTPILRRMPPVRGVVFGAMTLRDMLFEQMNLDDYNAVIQPRVHGILNLQRILQGQQQPDLDFFINLSSLSSVIGNMGQAAYNSSGTFMAAMAQYPALAGIPCRTLDLPMVLDVGYLADNHKRKEEVGHQLGQAYVDSSEIRALLAAVMRNEMQGKNNNHCLFGLHSIKTTPVQDLPFWAKDPKMSHLWRSSILAEAESTQVQQTDIEVFPAPGIRHASNRAGAEAVIAQAVVQKMANTLVRPVDEIDPSVSISTYGLDSLVAVEIRNWITRELESSLQLLEILTSDSVHALARIILNKSNLVSSRVRDEWDVESSKGS